MKKQYSVYLCEMDVPATGVTDFNLYNYRRCEVAANDSDFKGQAQNVMFYTKIDGTHELSFELHKYYFDEDKGEKVKNPLPEMIVNKSQLEVVIEDKLYFMTVNKREDKEEQNSISYVYTCNDSFVEELSKNGYSLTFTDDIELGANGLGTIHELTKRVLEGSGWKYDEEATGPLYEYTTDISWNNEQSRYDEVHTPVPVHPVEYIPEIGGFANRLDLCTTTTVTVGGEKIEDAIKPVYCYEDTRTVTTNTVKNILYNAKDCVDTVGWAAFSPTTTSESYNAYAYDSKDAPLSVLRDTYNTIEDGITISKNDYYLCAYQISDKQTSLFLENNTATGSNFTFEAGKIYAFRYKKRDHHQDWKNGKHTDLARTKKGDLPSADAPRLKRIIISNHSFATRFKNTNNTRLPGEITIEFCAERNDNLAKNDVSPNNTLYRHSFVPNKHYYLLKSPSQSISRPYFIFEFAGGSTYKWKNENYCKREYGEKKTINDVVNPLLLEDIEIFEIKGKETTSSDGKIITAEQNYLELLSNLTLLPADGEKDTTGTGWKSSDFISPVISEKDLEKMILPDNTGISARTQSFCRYFTRDNYYFDNEKKESIQIDVSVDDDEDALTYYQFEKIGNGKTGDGSRYIYENDSFKTLLRKQAGVSWPNKETMTDKEVESFNKDKTKFFGEPRTEEDKNKIFFNPEDQKYYQYYELNADNIPHMVGSTGRWDFALLGNGANDKRRTLVAEKSNRFNLIQDLAELFKVWPVFTLTRGEDGTIIKKVHFKEDCLKENFAGFHSGVNIRGLTRSVDSDEVVTKMFVEDIESDFVQDGFVTIRTSSYNPWGENYYYNFRYYIEQKILPRNIDTVVQELYTQVRAWNDVIYRLQQINVGLKFDLNECDAYLHGLALQKAALGEQMASIEADMKQVLDFNPKSTDDPTANQRLEMSETQKQNLQDKKDDFKGRLDILEKEIDTVQKKRNKLQEEYTSNLQEINTKMTDKLSAIHDFEKKYSLYIKEGTWAGSNYIENDAYYIDSQKVSQTSAQPKVSWTISVLDGDCFKELQEFHVEVGDKTFLVDPEFFDYEDRPDTDHKFEVLISGYKDYLDDPSKNEVEVRNYLTSFEDLFQRIAAATQTLELKEQTYDNSKFLSGSEINQNILQNTLLNNSLVLARATDNTYTIDNNGIAMSSISNPIKQVRIIADGIFVSDSKNVNGEQEWKTGITADGINASVITAGRINTSEVNIYSGSQVGFAWNELGITAYMPMKGTSSKDSEGRVLKGALSDSDFVRLDGFGLYIVESIPEFIRSDKGDVITQSGNTYIRSVTKDKDKKQIYVPNENFNYISGLPWYYSKDTYEDAIQYIQDNATVSITKEGFRLNVLNPYVPKGEVLELPPNETEGIKSDSPPGLTLGYYNTYAPNESTDYTRVYGLQITDAYGREVISLHHRIESKQDGSGKTPIRIGGWEIQYDKIRQGFWTKDENGRDYDQYAVALLANPNDNEVFRIYRTEDSTNTAGRVFSISRQGFLTASKLNNWKLYSDSLPGGALEEQIQYSKDNRVLSFSAPVNGNQGRILIHVQDGKENRFSVNLAGQVDCVTLNVKNLNVTGGGTIKATTIYADKIGTSKETQVDELWVKDLYLNGTKFDWASGGSSMGGIFNVPLTRYTINQQYKPDHGGIDMLAPEGWGAPIYASYPGTIVVYKNDWNYYRDGTSGTGSWGNYIKIDHGEINGIHVYTQYAHCCRLNENLQNGSPVVQGMLIGYLGNTGNVHSSQGDPGPDRESDHRGAHLHFETWEGNTRVNPMKYLRDIPKPPTPEPEPGTE